MTKASILDHIVVNVRMEMDEAEASFSELGFVLTPRGYHSLGSINALAIFQTDYLELLGLPADRPDARPELANGPTGLNGAVFKTPHADATFAHLSALGVAGDPPKSFSRPVTLADGSVAEARFRTVTLPDAIFPAGRLYFCEHQTPELVWRPEWQAHDCGVTGFSELVLVTDAPDERARLLERVLHGKVVGAGGAEGLAVELAGGFRFVVLTPSGYAARFGALAIEPGGRADMLGAAVVKGVLPVGFQDRLKCMPDRFEVAKAGRGVRVRVPRFTTLIEFEG
ncbi:MAG TPA: VOC family protein [Hyphomicrobiaceae bacterium]|nr:VOC family protein [Hyphomicrobiaceae bacterium]